MRQLSLLVAIFTSMLGPIQAMDRKHDQSIRYDRYHHISNYLKSLTDSELLTLLKEGTPLQSGWGSTIKLEIDGIPVFVKQVPLNEVEGDENNIFSTKNLFELPLYYQYGVGSGGFNVWREVSAHVMTTEWVLKGESQNFPLTYHWRILDRFQGKKPFNEEEFRKYVAYWGNASSIGKRIRANHEASANVVIFIEYIPETLKSWLSKEFKKEKRDIDKAIEMVEENLLAVSVFLNKNEMLHFDAHFDNILTDGERLYFSDFGLSISSRFALSKEELEFFKIHSNYDRYYFVTKLTNCIVGNLFGKDCLRDILTIYAEGGDPAVLPEKLTPYLSSIIKRYAPIALKMNAFFEILTQKNKQELYPVDELDPLWDEAVFNLN